MSIACNNTPAARIIVRIFILTIILAACVYFGICIIRIFIFDQFITPTESMIPTLLPGDRVVVEKTILGARIYSDFNFDIKGAELKSWRTRGLRPVKPYDVVGFNVFQYGYIVNFVINAVYA